MQSSKPSRSNLKSKPRGVDQINLELYINRKISPLEKMIMYYEAPSKNNSRHKLNK